MKDLSPLANGISNSMANGQWGDMSGNWPGVDIDPDGELTFEEMDGDAPSPAYNADGKIGHDHYKGQKGVSNG